MAKNENIKVIDERMPFAMFDIETGDGWKPIAQKVLDAIAEYNERSSEDSTIYVDQVKEKFARLEIYLTYDNVPREDIDRIESLIESAQDEASETCEICGTKENVGTRVSGWYTVMCEDCAKKIAKENFYYNKIGIKWRRNNDGKVFTITKDGTTEFKKEK